MKAVVKYGIWDWVMRRAPEGNALWRFEGWTGLELKVFEAKGEFDDAVAEASAAAEAWAASLPKEVVTLRGGDDWVVELWLLPPGAGHRPTA